MAFASDGKRALFAGSDKTVRLYDIDAGRDLRRFVGHTGSVWAVAFSPDGSQALSGSADRTVRLWDVDTGQELRRFTGHEDVVTSVAFSPDGKRAVSGGYDHTIILWDLEKRREIRRFDGVTRYINSVLFAPDGRRLAVCGEKAAYLIDSETGKEVARYEGHAAAVVCLAFSPDGRRVATGSDDHTVCLWDLGSGRQVRTCEGHWRPVKGVAFSRDGLALASAGSDHTVRYWDSESGRELRKFTKHAEPVIAVAFTPDGRGTLSGSRDAVVLGWSLAAAPIDPVKPPPTIEPAPPVKGELRPLATIPIRGTAANLLLSPNGKWLYFLNAAEGKLARVNTATMRLDGELQLTDGVEVITLSPDGKTLYAVCPAPLQRSASTDGRVQVIDPLTMAVRRTFAVPADPYDVAARDDGILYLSGGSGEWTEVTVVDASKGEVIGRWGGVWHRSFLKLAPDGKRLYFSTQGVSPGYVEALVIPARPDEKPVQYRSAARPEQRLGGDFLITPDGKFLLCKTGTILRLSADRDEELKPVASVEPFLAAATDPERGLALLLAADGSLKRLSYPDFKPQGSFYLGAVAYQAAYDGQQGRLYVVALDPRSLSDRPRGRPTSEIRGYDLKTVLDGKKAP
jgi:WD40 repeat protein